MKPAKSSSRLPLSVTRSALLAAGTDHAFREFLYDFLTLAERLQEIRRYLGERAGISGPQYSLLMAVAELEGSEGVRVGKVAEHLHVAGAFVTTEAGKLARSSYLRKVNDVEDKRAWRLRVTEKGLGVLRSLFPELREVNDTLFAEIAREEFAALRKCMRQFVRNSTPVMARVRAAEQSEEELQARNVQRKMGKQ